MWNIALAFWFKCVDIIGKQGVRRICSRNAKRKVNSNVIIIIDIEMVCFVVAVTLKH